MPYVDIVQVARNRLCVPKCAALYTELALTDPGLLHFLKAAIATQIDSLSRELPTLDGKKKLEAEVEKWVLTGVLQYEYDADLLFDFA